MMERSLDAARANAILNDPDVFRFVSENGNALDVTKQIAEKRNFLFLGEHGLTLYLSILPGIFEVHSAALKNGRGSWMLSFAQRSLDAIFTQSDAQEVMTRVPKGNVAATALTKACGFVHEFDSMHECLFDGQKVTPGTWRLSIHDWVKRSRYFAEVGAWMHHRLGEEAAKLGIKESPHAPDEHHDRVAGAALSMLRAGQLAKGLLYYDRWAVLARHAIVTLASADPVAVKMDIGVLRLKGDDIEVTRE